MNNAENKYDEGFQKLMDETQLESPSGDFTAHVMQQIADLEATSRAATSESRRTRVFFFAGISLLVLLGFSIMYYFDVTILPDQYTPIIAPVFENIIDSFRGIFAGVQLSSTTLVIIAGFVLLVLLERLLSKLKLTRNIYFSF